MHIENELSNDSLTILANFNIRFKELHTDYNNSNYAINYRYKDSVRYIFSNNVTQGTDNEFNSPYYECIFGIRDTNNYYYTNDNFDYTSALNSCTLNQSGNYSIPLIYNGNTSSTRSIASNLYQDNYLNIQQYATIVQPSPSPSPEPEEPTGGFESINPYFWILPSFLLMLMFMYRFLDKIFARGE